MNSRSVDEVGVAATAKAAKARFGDPLQGIRVTEIANFVSAPMIGLLLADFGADVIKIERTVVGDDARPLAPQIDGEGIFFVQNGRNKRSVALDLKDDRGAEAARSIALASDVVIDNMRVGTLEKFGLDYASLSAQNPRIISCSVTGFGRCNRYERRAAYDPILQAMSGLMTATGFDGDPPVRVGTPITDISAALTGVIGIMMALRAREVNGVGQQVSASLLGAATQLMASDQFANLATNRPRTRPDRELGGASGLIQVVYPKSGRPIVFSMGNLGIYRRVCEMIGFPDLPHQPGFSTLTDLVQNERQLNEILSERFRQYGHDHWATQLDSAGIPWGPVNSVRDFFRDEVVADNWVTTVTRSNGTEVPALRPPFSLSQTPAVPPTGPPLLGEHTEQVLREVAGLAVPEVADLLRSGVAQQWTQKP